MLPLNLQRAVFPGSAGAAVQPVERRVVELSKAHLRHHELPVEAERAPLPAVPFTVPALVGSDIEEHFWQLGSRMGQEHFKLAAAFAGAAAPHRFSAGHFKWAQQAGWTRYDGRTGECLGPVPHPEAAALVFDVETSRAFFDGKYPILAVAMSAESLYAWVSPRFLAAGLPAAEAEQQERLIRLGPSPAASLCIGHNISFDRVRVMEEYWLDSRSQRRFLDTLSMHSAVGGISSQQRMQWTKYKKERNAEDLDEELAGLPVDGEGAEPAESGLGEHGEWCEKGSMANLADAARLHCNGLVVDKGPRELLLKETDAQAVLAQLPLLLDYCANDVAATAALFRSLWPKFLAKCPHPVSFTAMLEMTTCFLPVDRSWPAYVERCEGMLSAAKTRLEADLVALAERRVAESQAAPADDPWMSRLDWTPVPAKHTKARFLKDGRTYAKGGEPRPIGNTALFGKPAWYRKLYNQRLGALELTTKARIVPYLLKMRWNGHPVHFLPEAGWCFGMAVDRPAAEAPRGEAFVDEAAPGWAWFRIPHSKEQGANVGCLLSKDFLGAFEKGTLTTTADDTVVRAVLELSAQFSFWTGYRERIRDGQLVVWADEPGVPLETAGAILPQCIPMGTVTRRAVEPTWMTASNPKPALVGSELKAMVRAPPGWCIVGADVDSQELWIASLLGDAQFGFAGATAIGWMTLQGTRAEGSDLHSRTAKLLGMTRDAAKIFTYGRIYGAGAKHAAQLLMKYDATLDAKAAADKARRLYHATKGRKAGLEDAACYTGGSESFMFNQLEAIARAPVSRTPALSAAISDALLSTSVQDEYLTSRVNWAVQSSGVDYLHMLLVSMKYLMGLYGIPGRLLLTIHDEVRYLTTHEHRFRLAAALQVANLWTRCMFVHRLGMRELPLSVAFFAAVDIDTVLRKEPTTSCVTPSHTTPIEPGQSLDIWALLKQAGPDGGLSRVSPEFRSWWARHDAPSIAPSCRQPVLPPAADSMAYLAKQAALRRSPKDADTPGSAVPFKGHGRVRANTAPSPPDSEAESHTLSRWKSLINRNDKP